MFGLGSGDLENEQVSPRHQETPFSGFLKQGIAFVRFPEQWEVVVEDSNHRQVQTIWPVKEFLVHKIQRWMNDNSFLMTYLHRRMRDVGRRATESPCSETAFSWWVYPNDRDSRVTTREDMLNVPGNKRHIHLHTAETQPCLLGSILVLTFFPGTFLRNSFAWKEHY